MEAISVIVVLVDIVYRIIYVFRINNKVLLQIVKLIIRIITLFVLNAIKTLF